MTVRKENKKTERIGFRVSRTAKIAFEKYAKSVNQLPSELLATYVESVGTRKTK